MKERILIVDDEKNVLHAFRRSLSDVYTIETALCGKEALEMIEEKGPFTVIVSDYKMPGMDGIEVLSLAKSLDPAMVRIMLTGYPDRDLALEAMDRGQVFQFLTKPCTSMRLRETIDTGILYHQLLLREKTLMEVELQRIEHEEKREGESSSSKREVLEEKKRLKGAYLSLSLLLQKKDTYTAFHHIQTAKLARALGERACVDPEMLEWIHMAAGLHDIGNIHLPLSILYKPYSLTTKEKLQVQSHVEEGKRMLEERGFPQAITTIVLEHHERLDGSGYPSGLKGEEISYGSKILAVADVVEAMGSHRPYRQALSRDKIIEELERDKGLLYDTEIVNQCQELLAEGYALGGAIENIGP